MKFNHYVPITMLMDSQVKSLNKQKNNEKNNNKIQLIWLKSLFLESQDPY